MNEKSAVKQQQCCHQPDSGCPIAEKHHLMGTLLHQLSDLHIDGQHDRQPENNRDLLLQLLSDRSNF
jgi:hypothetical protein